METLNTIPNGKDTTTPKHPICDDWRFTEVDHYDDVAMQAGGLEADERVWAYAAHMPIRSEIARYGPDLDTALRELMMAIASYESMVRAGHPEFEDRLDGDAQATHEYGPGGYRRLQSAGTHAASPEEPPTEVPPY